MGNRRLATYRCQSRLLSGEPKAQPPTQRIAPGALRTRDHVLTRPGRCPNERVVRVRGVGGEAFTTPVHCLREKRAQSRLPTLRPRRLRTRYRRGARAEFGPTRRRTPARHSHRHAAGVVRRGALFDPPPHHPRLVLAPQPKARGPPSRMRAHSAPRSHQARPISGYAEWRGKRRWRRAEGTPRYPPQAAQTSMERVDVCQQPRRRRPRGRTIRERRIHHSFKIAEVAHHRLASQRAGSTCPCRPPTTQCAAALKSAFLLGGGDCQGTSANRWVT